MLFKNHSVNIFAQILWLVFVILATVGAVPIGEPTPENPSKEGASTQAPTQTVDQCFEAAIAAFDSSLNDLYTTCPDRANDAGADDGELAVSCFFTASMQWVVNKFSGDEAAQNEYLRNTMDTEFETLYGKLNDCLPQDTSSAPPAPGSSEDNTSAPNSPDGDASAP
ncbi:hypothetical protein BGW42_000772 [Actinomortierella wolfii]|nr:hypothetical protein BGW42_000772 [Actinomortierella wolfii]